MEQGKQWAPPEHQKLLNRKDGNGTEEDAEFEFDFSDEDYDEQFRNFDPERFDRNDINQSLDRLNAALTRSNKHDWQSAVGSEVESLSRWLEQIDSLLTQSRS